ncbi:MAG TPA: UDP-N-acetylmuramoyl-L-alanyl-D-glutamate--2,6-diaminopimelate ligase, partial [Bacteroidales bacterium]|nr:UDP-N-acetylmuramoyl-L-alanyl-D-glutamate--2,6-diaminopimelate ligase [Bacteroidales bacterium]
YVRVVNSAAALGIMASAFYNYPSRNIRLVGVTGTNGKTTTATLLYRLIRNLGYGAGLLSTVANYINDKEYGATHTTPDSVKINELLAEMVEQGCQYCFMEVSSHSLDQDRTAGLAFTGGIFTNLTHDHLDYHKTFDNYLKAKKKFFDQLDKNAFALVNNDDRNGKVMLQNTVAKKYTYGVRSAADFRCRVLESHFDGMKLLLERQEVWVRLIGRFNAYNLTGVYAAAVLLGINKSELLPVLSTLEHVRGRFEYYTSPGGITAIVDYAHTPDALENVLETINSIRKLDATLITICGAGGDRDRTKRPVMARAAVDKSTRVILTSDNPRSEDPEQIINEMMEGVPAENKKKVLAITNRKEAIRTACIMAAPGDIILVAGKGHETYQEIKGVRHHFDDMEVVVQFFKEG